MVNERLKISPPWVTFVNKVKAMFDEDPDVTVSYTCKSYDLNIHVNDAYKAAAIERLLPEEVNFGNFGIFISVIPPPGSGRIDINGANIEDIFDTAFAGNPVYKETIVKEGLFDSVFVYVCFTSRIVQFFNDNLCDVHGNITTLYQDIASEIFSDDLGGYVNYCTEALEDSSRQWP